jgi:hypothetical protein
MTIHEETDFQEKERKTYSPEYQFGQHWIPVQNISYDAQTVKSLGPSNPYMSDSGRSSESHKKEPHSFLSDGGYIMSLPDLAIGGILWLDNGRVFFTDLRKGRISSLRLRVKAGLPFCALGAFWIPREERLVIHDIYKMGIKNLWKTMTFSERWSELEAVSAALAQDVDFQGFTLELAELVPFAEAAAEAVGGPVVWIQPQKAGSRAIRIHAVTNIGTNNTKKTDNVISVTTPVIAETSRPVVYTQLFVAKDPVRMGPEAYRLYTESGEDCGQPAIQKLSVSQTIRNALTKQTRTKVDVRWNVSFGRYEVLGCTPA